MNRQFIKSKLVPYLFKAFGGSTLTHADLGKYNVDVVTVSPEQVVQVPDAIDYNSPNQAVVPGGAVRFPSTHIFRFDYNSHGDCLKKFNAIVLPGKKAVLSGIDVNLARVSALTPGFLQKKSRQEEVIVAPWPHLWATYGDFVFFALPKLARLVANLSHYERDRAVVSFPFSLGEWAREYVELLGIPRERQIDSTKEKLGLSRSGVLIAGDGPSHAQSIAHPADLSLAKELVSKNSRFECSPLGRRIFISRRGRRKLEGEDDIYRRLKSLEFIFLPDEPRSIREQIGIFSDAETVVGAHGAGLCNALWGKAHASVVEAKSSAWDLRSFRVWCAMRGAGYGVLFDRRSGDALRLDQAASNTDIQVNPDRFVDAVRAVLNQER